MRILFLSNFYPPYERGGYEQLCKEVADGLRAKGHTVLVLTSDDRVKGEPPVEENVLRVLKTEVDARPYRGIVEFLLGPDKRYQETRRRFEEAVASFKPDVLFVWGMWDLPRELLNLAESWPSIKVVYYVADYWPRLPDAYTLHWKEPAYHWYSSIPKKIVGKIALGLRRKKLAPLKFEHVLCVSQALRQELIKSGLPFENARVVHNGIDLRPFLEAGKIHAGREPGEETTLLYAGRLERYKDIHTVIEAAAGLIRKGYSITLDLYGKGPVDYRDSLIELSRKLGVTEQVRFRKFIAREQMPETLAQHDILLFSSVWPEPLARIIQEAMAAGLVVIGTEVGGVPEILHQGVNGLTFTPGNAEELAARIEQVAADRDLYRRLSAAAQTTVKDEFDIRRMIDEVERYLLAITGSHENSVSVPLVSLSTR